MAFDPSIISDIGGSGPDIPGSIAKGFQLKDLMDGEQLDRLRVNSQKRQVADQDTIREVLSGSDLSTEKGLAEASEKLTRKGQWQQALDLRKYGESVASGELEKRIKEVQFHAGVQDYMTDQIGSIVNSITPFANARKPDGTPKYDQATLNAMTVAAVAKGTADIQHDDTLDPKTKQAMMSGIQRFMQAGQPTFDGISQAFAASKQGQQQLRDHLQQLNIGSQIETRTKQQANIDSEISARDQKTKDQREGSSLSPEGQRLQDELSLKDLTFMTRMSAAGIKSRTKTINDWAAQGVTAEDVQSGRISYKADTAEGVSLGKQDATLAKVENALSRKGGVGDQAIQAADSVDFGKVRALNGVSSWFGRNVSDPKLAAYVLKMQALTSEYAQVITRGGASTEGARQEAQAKIDSLQSPEAVRALVVAIKQETRTNRDALRDERAKVGKKQTATGDNQADPLGIR